MNDREAELERQLLYVAQKAERHLLAVTAEQEARKALIDPSNTMSNAQLLRIHGACISGEKLARTLLGYALQDARSFLEPPNDKVA